MKPLRVRTLTEAERERLDTGLRSPAGFVLRRCQIILASARGERAPAIAATVGCDDETVRDVIRAFNAKGLAALERGSTRPYRTQAAFTAEAAERLKEMLHHSPREYGKPTSLWTLELAAEASLEQGLTAERVSDETVRATLKRLDVSWKRAKRWITSPDPAYARKKTPGTD